MEQVSQEHVLLLTTHVLLAQTQCSTKGFAKVIRPSIITILNKCSININGSVFSIRLDSINGTRYVLPELNNISKQPTSKLLVLQVQLDEISSINQVLNHIKPVVIEEVAEDTPH